MPKWPSIKLADLAEPGRVDELLTVFEWAYEKTRE